MGDELKNNPVFRAIFSLLAFFGLVTGTAKDQAEGQSPAHPEKTGGKQAQVTPNPLNFPLIILLAVVSVTSCALARSPSVSTSWRYKMTVEVKTPEGLKTGAAVREVTDTKVLATGKHYPKVKGEAVVVDLGKRGLLFALLRSPIFGADYAHLVSYYAFPCPKDSPAEEYLSKLKNAKITLNPRLYPTFVHFKDSSDPKTVENVLDIRRDVQDPQQIEIESDRTEAIYGVGVKITQVTIEVTDEPVTAGKVELPWLAQYYSKRLDGQRYGASSQYPFANSLSSGSLKAGD